MSKKLTVYGKKKNVRYEIPDREKGIIRYKIIIIMIIVNRPEQKSESLRPMSLSALGYAA